MCLKLYVSGSIQCVANSFRNILTVQKIKLQFGLQRELCVGPPLVQVLENR